jgi:Tfp pilus assembly protein PilO
MNTVREYQKPIMVGVLGFVVAILLYALLVAPQSSKLSSLNAQKTTLATQQQQLQIQLTSLEKEKQQLPTKCASLQKITLQIPSVQNPGDLAAEQSSFYNQLTALVGSSGTGIPSFAWTGNAATTTTPITAPPAAGAPATAGGVVPVPVKMHITGTYGQMSAFIAGLDSFPRLFVIQSFTLAIGGAAGSAASTGSTGSTGSAASAAPTAGATPLWVGGTPTAAGSGPYGLDLAGSIYYTATPSALAACTKATAK